MKKLFYVFIFVFAVTSITQAQSSRIKAFKPSFQVMVRGAYSFPLSHSDFKDNFKSFPGVQGELIYDFNPCWGVYGNFSADFISLKDSLASFSSGGVTSENKSYTQLTGYVGPRYYINLRSAPLWKILVDAGLGIYSLKQGDASVTSTTLPPLGTTTTTFTANTQWGVNLGAGANVVVGSRVVINFGAKYHFVFKKSDASVSGTTTFPDGTTTTFTGTTTLAERSYLQLMLGVGFRLVGDM